jgi:hypothetical protein
LGLWQKIEIIGHIWRFIIVPQRTLPVKLEIPDKVFRIMEIARPFNGNPYFNRLPVTYLFGYRHNLYLKWIVLLYFQFISFAGGQQYRANEHCQQDDK